MTESGRSMVLIERPKPTGIFTECTVTNNLSKALNLELYWDTYSKTYHITDADKCSFRLNLIPIGLSLWLTWFSIVIPPYHYRSRPVTRVRSFTLARKCPTGSIIRGKSQTHIKLRSYGIEPPALSRDRVIYLDPASHDCCLKYKKDKVENIWIKIIFAAMARILLTFTTMVHFWSRH